MTPKKPSQKEVKEANDAVIYLTAQVAKVTTTIDGGWSITLGGSGQYDAVLKFIKAKHPGIILDLVAVAVDTSKEELPKNGPKIHI